MGKIYKQGIVSPKGFDLSSPEPVDQRTVVQYMTDLYILPNVYRGLQVIVLEEINGIALREYKFMGGAQNVAANWAEVGTGSGSYNPADLPLKFTSFVFKRQIGAPVTPTGGTYDNPVPAGWSDAVPAGTDPLWTSSAIFTQGSLDPIVWTTPILAEDNNNLDFEYCNIADVPVQDIQVSGLPLPPSSTVGLRPYWHNDPTPDDTHMAMGTKVGGAYPTDWKVVKIQGEQGADGAPGAEGRKYLTSFVFARTNMVGMDRAVVAGGGFSSPYPTSTKIDGVTVAVSWQDGIPVGDAQVWMTSFTFNSVSHASPSTTNIWKVPGKTTDTATTDFEFSSNISQPADPTTDPSSWHNIAAANDIWMAVRTITNGVIGTWGITRIKGETGDTGAGLDIAGRDTIANILLKTSPPVALYDIWLASDTNAGATVPGVVNDAYLYVGAGNGEAGTAWDNIGSITGTDGISYKQSYVFKRSATQPATPTGGTFSDPVPAGWTDGIPAAGTPALAVWASNRVFASDPTANAALADWKAPYLAQDTVDYDFKYANMQLNDSTPLPPHQAAGGVWYETPTTVSYWMAKGKLVNGVIDTTTWEVIRIKGEKGDSGSDGVPSFLASAYMKTNNDISGASVTGGTYSNPVPTSTISGVSWSDGIPVGNGAIWFTQVKFSQTDSGTKVWPAPTLIADSTTVEYLFSASTTKPTGNPVENNDGANTWYDDASTIEGLGGTPKWMAIGSRRNGVWPTEWDIVKITGETGADGLEARTYIPSSRFCRCDNTSIEQVNVTGQYLVEVSPGEYAITGANPTTDTAVGGHVYEFTDGIPAKTGTFPNNAIRIWVIQQVFNSVDDLGPSNVMSWGTPSLLADNNNTDYQYHAGASASSPGTKPSIPTGTGSNPDSAGWYDYPDSVPNGAFWIAQRNWSDGPGAQWVVYQIRGEDGTDGGVITTPAPSIPTGLYVYRDGWNERAVWNGSTPAAGLTIAGYEVEETLQGLGTFTSTSLSVVIAGFNSSTGGNGSFKVRAVDSVGKKSAWSTPYTYVPADATYFGYLIPVSVTCGSSTPAANPNAYVLIEGGRDIDNGGYAYTSTTRAVVYPVGTYSAFAYSEAYPTKRNIEFKVLAGGACTSLQVCP